MKTITFKFVDLIPNHLEEGVLYISTKYCTAVHKCFCGCGEEVATTLSPGDWKLIFDGKTVSLYPSIGNRSYACKSHYWIRNNQVEWEREYSKEDLDIEKSKYLFKMKKWWSKFRNRS